MCVVTSSYSNWYKKSERKFLSGGLVKMKVLAPFQTKGLGLDAVSNLTKHLQAVMQRELDQLNRDIALDSKYLIEHHNHDCHSEHNVVPGDDNNNSMIIDNDSMLICDEHDKDAKKTN